jgi:hypothetical protein
MTATFMPQPGITACTSAEAKRTPNLDPEQVEAVCQAMHSSNQLPSVVADLQDAMSRMHVATALVQLPKAYNVGGESRDEVRPREWDVFAVRTVPEPSIATSDPSPILMLPRMVVSMSMKAPR